MTLTNENNVNTALTTALGEMVSIAGPDHPGQKVEPADVVALLITVHGPDTSTWPSSVPKKNVKAAEAVLAARAAEQ